MKSKDRKDEYKEVQEVDGKVIIATYGVASTGINIVRIFNLVLFEAGKSFVRVIQSIGRGIRVAPDKDFVNVYDVCSNCKYSKKHLTKRKSFYKEADYPFTVQKIIY
jgi:type I site-specific restriction endonuclease